MAKPITSLDSEEIPYPAATRGRLRRMSARRPETAFITDAVPSARPSIKPTTEGGAPSTPVRNNGSTG